MTSLGDKKINKKAVLKAALAIGSLASAILLSSPAMADDSQTWPAILRSSDGKVVHNNFGECWGLGANHVTANPTPECGQNPPPPPQPAPAPMAAAEPPPPPPPPPAPAPQHVSKKISISADVLFDFDKAVVKPAGKQRIDEELGKVTQNMDEIQSVMVVGNTDSIGSDAYNQKLSERRADAVKAYLVSKGIPADKISTEGHGKRDPVASNKTKEGRAKNRRADITFDLLQ